LATCEHLINSIAGFETSSAKDKHIFSD